MKMITVKSSAIAAIGYNADTQQMQIKFNDGGTYTYCRVPSDVFAAFLAAPSKGRYYDHHIKGKYGC